jgi:hypothetical protein
MNEIAKLPANKRCLLPIHETDGLSAKVGKLLWIEAWSCKFITSPRWAYEMVKAQDVLEELLNELPSDASATAVQLDKVVHEKATREQIADVLTVLHGLFDSRGSPEIMASVGVDIIEAEHASAIALYSTGLAMLRPAPKICKNPDYNPEEEEPIWERPPPRKFIPTIPEIITELRDQEKWWRNARATLKRLRERHARARKEIAKLQADDAH